MNNECYSERNSPPPSQMKNSHSRSRFACTSLRKRLGFRDEDIREELEKIAELVVLRDVQNGRLLEVPSEEARKYLIVMSDEICHCLVDAGLYKRVVKRRGGYYHGLSFRIAKGVYYRIGTYTPPEIKEEITKVDEVVLAITSKRFIFVGKVPLYASCRTFNRIHIRGLNN